VNPVDTHRRPIARRGFTVVELLAVVAVLGVLAALAIPAGLKALHRARQAKAMDDMKDMATYIAGRLPTWSSYPAVLTIRRCPTCPWEPYLRKDPWGHAYVYSSTGDGYEVRCLGRDGLVSAGISRATRDRFDFDIVLRDGIFVNQPF
jgi:general secretion pathway protein G